MQPVCYAFWVFAHSKNVQWRPLRVAVGLLRAEDQDQNWRTDWSSNRRRGERSPCSANIMISPFSLPRLFLQRSCSKLAELHQIKPSSCEPHVLESPDNVWLARIPEHEWLARLIKPYSIACISSKWKHGSIHQTSSILLPSLVSISAHSITQAASQTTQSINVSLVPN